MDILTDYISILTDPAHWMFELTVQLLVDGLLLGVGWRLGMRWVKRHDRRHHNHESEEDTARAMAEVHAALERDGWEPDDGTVSDDWWLDELEAARQRKLRAIDKMDPAARLIYLKAHPEMIEEDI